MPVILLSLLGLFGLNAGKTYMHLRPGIPVDTYSDTAQFLRDHAQPNDMVMHTEWEDFPILFYHNASLRYLSGLDPTFFYKGSPERYRIWSEIMTPPSSGSIAPTLRESFDASFVIVQPKRAALIEALRADPEITERHEGKHLTIFSVDSP